MAARFSPTERVSWTHNELKRIVHGTVKIVHEDKNTLDFVPNYSYTVSMVDPEFLTTQYNSEKYYEVVVNQKFLRPTEIYG